MRVVDELRRVELALVQLRAGRVVTSLPPAVQGTERELERELQRLARLVRFQRTQGRR